MLVSFLCVITCIIARGLRVLMFENTQKLGGRNADCDGLGVRCTIKDMKNNLSPHLPLPLVSRRLAAIPLSAWVDTAIMALCGAALFGRAGHVALQWDYFAAHLDEAWRLNAGGVDWHGAALGGLIGAWIAGQIRRWVGARTRQERARHALPLRFATVLALYAPLVPLIALWTWIGCASSGCASGAEVDTLANYPALIVRELLDVYGIVAPRWNTPLFGIVGSTLIFALMVGLRWRRGAHARQFWLALALTAALMLAIGTVIRGLRADMVLDIGAIIIGAMGTVWIPKSLS